MYLKAIWTLLPMAHRKKSRWVIVLIILRSLLDLVGIAALLSLLFILLNRDSQSYLWLAISCGVVFIILKNILTVRIDTYCSDWFLSLYRYYSSSLLNSYYRKGLLFIREKSTTTLSYEVNSVCYAFVMNVLSPMFQIAGKTLLVLTLFITFIIFSPYSALAFILSMTLIAWFYIGYVRKRITLYGKRENCAKKQQWKNVQELFRGYMEIEINQAFESLNDRFEKEMENISCYRRKVEMIQRIPPSLMEIGMIIALVILILMTQNNQELTLLLGAFTIAGMRILPSVRFLISGWTQICNHFYTVEVITKALEGSQNTTEIQIKQPVFNNFITVEQLSFTYKTGEVPALYNFSIEVRCGEYVGIQGASGIGKSTLFNLLLGFIKPDSGQIQIDGIPLDALNLRQWHKMVGYVPQDIFIIDGTIAENIALGVENEIIDTNRLYAVLKQMRLDRWIDELPEGINTNLGENGSLISGGQKQRIGIARTLYNGAKVLFLDEATSALDEQTEEEILQIIRDLPLQGYEITLLMIAHRQSSLSKCDRIVKIN